MTRKSVNHLPVDSTWAVVGSVGEVSIIINEWAIVVDGMPGWPAYRESVVPHRINLRISSEIPFTWSPFTVSLSPHSMIIYYNYGHAHTYSAIKPTDYQTVYSVWGFRALEEKEYISLRKTDQNFSMPEDLYKPTERINWQEEDFKICLVLPVFKPQKCCQRSTYVLNLKHLVWRQSIEIETA